MRRLAWLALILGLVLLIGCGGSDTGSGTTTVKLVVWKPNNPAAWDSALVLFHAQYPDIRIEREIGPHSSTQFHDLLTQKLRNHDPSVDVFLMDVIWTPEFAQAGWAMPLDSLFPVSEQRKFFDGCIKADQWNNDIYGVALNIDGGILYFRKDLLDKYGFSPPETWNEMLDQIETIRAKESDPNLFGYSGQFKQYEGLVCDMLEFVNSNGGDLLQPTLPATEQAIAFVRDEIIDAAAPRGVLTYEEQESLDLFTAGGAIFHRNWPYAWSITKQSPIAGKVGMTRLPTFKDGMHTSTLGGWRMAISQYSQHKDAAWKVVQFFTSPAMNRHFAVIAGRAPARKALYSDSAVLAANPHFEAMYPVFETATPRPRTPIYPQVSHILQRFMQAAISDRTSDIPALAKRAEDEITEAMATVQ